MLQVWAINLVIAFIIRQIAKFGTGLDWDKVTKDADDRVRALIPGEWFDDESVVMVNLLLEAAKKALADTADIEKIMDLCASKKWAEATEAFKTMVVTIWKPVSEDGERLYALLNAGKEMNAPTAA